MKTGLRIGLLLAGMVVLSACANSPFGKFGGGAGGDGADGVNVGDGVISESSIAFFNTTVGDRVLFPVDQSTLTDEAIAVLDQQAAWLNENTQYSAVIEGHADEQGTRDYNMALSARRATAVYNYLISRGVAAGRLETIPFGKDKPLAICSEEACWAKNRRAMTVVAGGIGA